MPFSSAISLSDYLKRHCHSHNRSSWNSPARSNESETIDAGLITSQVELVRQAFHESFAAAFTDTLRLNLIWPIAIAILVAITLRSKEAKTDHI